MADGLLLTAPRRDRARAAIGAAALHALIGWAFLAGLGATIATEEEERLTVFAVPAEPPPNSAPAPRKASAGPEGEAAPHNLRARPAEIVAPRPEVRIETPPPLLAAPRSSTGPDSRAGAADRAGPGTGAGGAGDGLGSGRAGSGTRGGGGIASRARHLRGRIAEDDLPRTAWARGTRGSVTVRLTVEADGGVSGCSVARSSGDAELDALTCRLIRQRFVYEPARDRAGRAVRDVAGWRQDWWTERG